MAETSIITISDVSIYRKIDSKTNQEKFNAFVMEAQRSNLRDLLGDELYYDFFLNIDDAKYIALRDGEPYINGGLTQQYYGLKPFLSYCYLAISAREGDMYHSHYGAVQFSNNSQQNFESAKDKQRIHASYMEQAAVYRNDIIKYLNARSSAFPLWKSEVEINKTNFISFRV